MRERKAFLQRMVFYNIGAGAYRGIESGRRMVGRVDRCSGRFTLRENSEMA